MPLDSTHTAPSLRMLSDILRDPSRWPEGFEWDYSQCATCAMGMAQRLWGLGAPDPVSGFMPIMAQAMGMHILEAKRIFAQLPVIKGVSLFSITPEHVADAIDAYLAREGK